MPGINLKDGRHRDALVRAEHTAETATVTFVDANGARTQSRKVLKAPASLSFERLAASAGDIDKLGLALVAGDPDTDIERVGMFLSDPSRVYVNDADEIVYQIEQVEVMRGASGEVKDRRPRRRAEPNTECEIPLTWTGRMIPKAEALRKFVFSSKLQIVHVNGLTYDFLFGMAKELADANALMLLGAGASGKEPLILRRGSTPHRGFLEGRVKGDKYLLILHLSKMELKRPAVPEAAVVSAAAPQPVAAAPAILQPATQPAEPRTPTAREVLAQIVAPPASPDPSVGAHEGVAATVASAKAAKRKQTKTTVEFNAEPAGESPVPAQSAPPKPRARKPRSAAPRTPLASE